MTKKQDLFKHELDASCIAKNLYTLMLNKGVSEIEIARALNIPVMTIRRVISGETEDPRISTLKIIADYFDASIDSLLDKNQNTTSLMKENKTQYIPMLNWDVLKTINTLGDLDLKTWEQWYPLATRNNIHSHQPVFALESRPSMQPRFPQGTLFIMNPNETPMDGDILLIKMRHTNELSLRELAIDSPKWQLQPIVSGSELLFFDKTDHSIMGIVILSMLYNRK